jgi:glycerol-3-phosphate dehydrogenase (NAD(P)+)
MTKIGVLGTTSWGTTLAILAAQKKLDVCLWSRTEQEANQLQIDGVNKRFLPNSHFPPNLRISSSTLSAVSDAEVVILAVPSNTLRTNLKAIKSSLKKSTVIVSATKGLEQNSGKRMSEIIHEETDSSCDIEICVLSGPNLASEIIQGKPSSTVVASLNQRVSKKVQNLLISEKFRVYTNKDIISVEYGGALKNIIAIGAGVCDGLGLGDNAKAGFMTRGLAEITRLAVAAGAEPLTLSGLSGMGDLIATCSSNLSRNHFVGRELARGKTLAEIQSSMKNVAEGINTTSAAIILSNRLGVEMPITMVTYKVLFEKMSVQQAIKELMDRDPTPE